MCPGVALVPVADSVTGPVATWLAVTSFASHLTRFCVLGKRWTVSLLILGCFVNSPNFLIVWRPSRMGPWVSTMWSNIPQYWLFQKAFISHVPYCCNTLPLCHLRVVFSWPNPPLCLLYLSNLLGLNSLYAASGITLTLAHVSSLHFISVGLPVVFPPVSVGYILTLVNAWYLFGLWTVCTSRFLFGCGVVSSSMNTSMVLTNSQEMTSWSLSIAVFRSTVAFYFTIICYHVYLSCAWKSSRIVIWPLLAIVDRLGYTHFSKMPYFATLLTLNSHSFTFTIFMLVATRWT